MGSIGQNLKKNKMDKLSKYYNIFRPLPWQVPVLQDTSEIILLDGTAGGGKSRVVLEKAHLYALMYPGASILFVKKSYNTVYQTMVLPFLKDVVFGASTVSYKKQDRMIQYSNGSVIFLAGMLGEKESERIKGIGLHGGLDLIVADEYISFTKEDHYQLLGRLRSKIGGYLQLIACTNPSSKGHWIYQDLILGRKAKRYHSRYTENTYNSEGYGNILDQMTGVMRARLRDGEWETAEGAVFPEYTPDIHVIRPIYLPPHWRRIRAIDFGYNVPFVCQWWAISPDNVMYMYREIYQTKLLVEDAAKIIKQYTGDEKIEVTIRDHDAEDAATLHRHGIPTTPASKFKTKLPAIQAIKERLLVGGNRKAKMYLFDDALIVPDMELAQQKKIYSTAQEFEAYVYDKAKNDVANEEPIKKDDHGMDAMRYAVTYIDGVTEDFLCPPSAESVRMINEQLQGLSGLSSTGFF